MKVRLDVDEAADIPMGPLIDCVFLLLIFFLVATMEKVQSKDIEVNLPDSTSAQKLKPDKRVLVVGVDSQGGFYLEGMPAKRSELQSALLEVSQLDPGRRIRLDADAQARVHAVVEILDYLQFRNLNNVGIRTYDQSR
jgi:biopolymer transport protein ExbD